MSIRAFQVLARFAPLRGLDQYILRRMPVLWRTRVVYAVPAVALFHVALFVLVLNTRHDDASGEAGRIETIYTFGSYAAWTGVLAWMWVIQLRSIRELPLRAHLPTFLAVLIIGYAAVVAPSVASAYAVDRLASVVKGSDLDKDHSTVTRYRQWTCVPESGKQETAELKEIFTRYEHRPFPEPAWEPTPEILIKVHGKECAGTSSLGLSVVLSMLRANIQVYQDAQDRDGRFAAIYRSFTTLVIVGFVPASLAVFLSYPMHVWRRRTRVALPFPWRRSR